MASRARLKDDGTLDTVIACPECGLEVRYNYDGEGGYDEFVKWAMEDFYENHEGECEEDENA